MTSEANSFRLIPSGSGLYVTVEDEPEKEAEKPATRIDSELDAELMNIEDDDLEIE
jgi:hypothetical protein